MTLVALKSFRCIACIIRWVSIEMQTNATIIECYQNISAKQWSVFRGSLSIHAIVTAIQLCKSYSRFEICKKGERQPLRLMPTSKWAIALLVYNNLEQVTKTTIASLMKAICPFLSIVYTQMKLTVTIMILYKSIMSKHRGWHRWAVHN